MSPRDSGGGAPCPLSFVPALKLNERPQWVMILGDFLGVELHWLRGGGSAPRSVACRGPGQCPHCKRRLASRYGYAPALKMRGQEIPPEPVILSIHEDYADRFPAPHRGRAYLISRHQVPGRNYSTLDIVHRPDLSGQPPCEAFPVLPAVTRMLEAPAEQLRMFRWDALGATAIPAVPPAAPPPPVASPAATPPPAHLHPNPFAAGDAIASLVLSPNPTPNGSSRLKGGAL